MSFNKYTPINKLNSSKIKWNIRVRVQALWKGITRETKEFRGLNMILVDDSKFRIHAFVNARFALQFEKELEEGQIYNVSNFIVQEYSGVEFHRCVRFDKHIYFADYTKVLKTPNDGLKISEWSFDFFDLPDLEKMQTDKRFLCDVVGIIKDEDPMVEFTNDNKEDKKQKKFSITDGRCTHKVTFFDKLAESLEEALKQTVGQNNVLIISSVKIGSFQGELNLTNYPATRFYINVNHTAVKDLQKRASEPTFYQSLPLREEKTFQLLTVNEIKNLGEEDIETEVVCDVTIKKVEEDLQWYDRICRKCNVEVHIADGRFKCAKCGRFYTWPPRRFRVCVLCSDHTGVIPVILGDLAIRRLTSKTFFDFDLDLVEGDESNNFPRALSELKNTHCYVTIKLSADNVNNESDGYEASDITMEADNLFGSNTLQESMEPEDDSTNLAETDVLSTILQTSQSTINNDIHQVQDIKEKQGKHVGASYDEMKSPPTATSTFNNLVRKSPEIESGSSNAIPSKNFKMVKKKKGKEVAVKYEKSKKSKNEKSLNNQPIDDMAYFDEDSMTLTNFQNNRKKKGKDSRE